MSKFLFKLVILGLITGVVLGFYEQQGMASSKEDLLLPLSLFTFPLVFSEDEKITSSISSHYLKNRSDREVMEAFSFLGDGRFQLFSLGVLYTRPEKYHRETARLAFKSWVRAGIYTWGLKALFGRARPYQNRKGFFGPNFKYDSFPSGHTSTAFTLATVLGERYRMKGFFYTIATLVGYSRVALGKHYPSDVLAGAIIGYLAGKQVLNKYDRKDDLTFFLLPEGGGICLSIR